MRAWEETEIAGSISRGLSSFPGLLDLCAAPLLVSVQQGRNSSLVVFGLAVHSVAGFDPPLGTFSGRGDFSLGVKHGFKLHSPQKLFRMRV